MADIALASSEPEALLWKCLRDEPIGMLGQVGNTQPLQPMFHHADRAANLVRFFVSRETLFFKFIGLGITAHYTLIGLQRDVFVSLSGTLTEDLDRLVLQALWNPVVAAWFNHDINNPDIALVALRIQRAAIWATPGIPSGFSYGSSSEESHGVHRSITFDM